MTVRELFDFVNSVRPGHAFSDAQLMVWLNECEARVQTDIMLIEPVDVIEYDSTIDAETGKMVDADTELLVPFPWNKIYRYFMYMMIDIANGEANRQANDQALYNEAYEEYAGWYASHIAPANGLAEMQGYYISAYGYAVRGGYTGTIEDFYNALGQMPGIKNATLGYLLQAQEAASTSTNAAQNAYNDSLDAEAWARGTRANVPVTSDQIQHENNAKFYAESIAGDADQAHYWALQAIGTAQTVTAEAIGDWLDEHPTALSDAVVQEKLSKYATVADMQADTALAIGQVVVTLGCTVLGDNGGCAYYVSDTEITGEYNILLGNGKYAVMIPPKGAITPEMFGATGDGIADDKDAIKAALLYAYTKGYDVLIDKNINSSTSITAKVNIYSHNNSTLTCPHILCESDISIIGVKLKSTSTNSDGFVRVSNNHKLYIDGCEFSFTNPTDYRYAMKASVNAYVTITNTRFIECGTVFNHCEFVHIDKCKFEMNYANTNFECVQFTNFTAGKITDNEFYHSKNDFIDLFSAGMDCLVSGNTFDGCQSHNMIEAKTTIRDEDAPGGSSTSLGFCRRNVITNNHFKNLIAIDSGVYSYVGIIVVYDGDYTDDVEDYPGEDVVEGNIFEGCDRINASIQPVFYGVCCFGRNTIIANNVIDIIEPTSTERSAGILVGAVEPTNPVRLKTQNIIVTNNVIGGNSFGISVRTNGPNINILGNTGKTGHSLKYFIRIGTTVNSETIIDVSKIIIKDNACSVGSYASFAFMYCNANLIDFVISGNVTDKNMAFANNLTRGVVSNNIFDWSGPAISLSAIITSVIVIGNNFNTTTSTAGSIYANANTTFAYCTICNNISRNRPLLRFLGTGTTPVMLGNVVANSEDNTIKTN